MVIPIVVAICVMVGTLLRAFWGWLSSDEPFIARKFAATLIFTIFAGAVPVTLAHMASAAIVIGPFGLLGVGYSALLAGWGADSLQKELGRLREGVGRGK